MSYSFLKVSANISSLVIVINFITNFGQVYITEIDIEQTIIENVDNESYRDVYAVFSYDIHPYR